MARTKRMVNRNKKVLAKVHTPGSYPAKSSPGRGRPKKGTKKVGSSRLGNYRHRYDEENLRQAIADVKGKVKNLNAAAKAYGIPKTTLFDRLKANSDGPGQVGRPTELAPVEEEELVSRLLTMASWNFPLTAMELRENIKSYLDMADRKTRFVDNMPGPDFVTGFLNRHQELTVRAANPIKRARAALSCEKVESFF